ncbi:MAG: hypothetical protein Q7W02_24635 [Candidatus Rokubacteria bacterium]|nr:hypothetical protein [Candidatus Rokubacteria bacterium]
MKKLWIICTVAVLLATGFALPVMAEDQNVVGTWNGTVRVRQGNRLAEDEFTLVLKQDGQAVTGTWSQKLGGTGSRGGKAAEDIPANGTLAGDKLSLKIGQRRWLEATVNGDSMNGRTAAGDNPAGIVTGTRPK